MVCHAVNITAWHIFLGAQELHTSKFYAIITIEISKISSIVKSTYQYETERTIGGGYDSKK